MSSGKKKSTTTTINNTDPPSWSTDYFKSALNQAQNLASQPYQSYGGPTVAGFSQDQLDSMDLTRQQAAQSGQLQNQGSDYVSSVINGGSANPYIGQTNQFSGENPYLQNMIDSAGRDITQKYSDVTLPSQLAQFSAGGAYGGSAMQQALTSGQQTLAQQLSDTNYQYRNADYDRQANLAESALNRNSSLYNQDQQLRQSALGFLPQLQQMGYNDASALGKQGALQQSLVQQAINDDRDDYAASQNWSADRLGLLTGALGSIRGGTGVESKTGDNPAYKSAAENGAAYAQILASLWGS